MSRDKMGVASRTPSVSRVAGPTWVGVKIVARSTATSMPASSTASTVRYISMVYVSPTRNCICSTLLSAYPRF